jgi:hypothetical protein
MNSQAGRNSSSYDNRRVADLIGRLLPGIVVADLEPVERSTDRSPSVYKATLGNGKVCAVKLASDSLPASLARNAIATEAATLRGLSYLGCNTPRVVAFDASLGALATDWLEGPTLERRLSTEGPDGVGVDSARKRISRSRNESAWKSLVRETENVFEFVKSAARAMAVDSGRSPSAAEDAAADLQRQVTEGVWTIGSRDYNASNVLLSPDGPYFVDFSAIGADWPERRMVGYLIATGAGRKSGNFVTTLDERAARIYEHLGAAVWDGHAAGALLDAHFLAAILYSIERLARALRSLEEPESRTLLEAWSNSDQRLLRLHDLARVRLLANPTADRLRSALG